MRIYGIRISMLKYIRAQVCVVSSLPTQLAYMWWYDSLYCIDFVVVMCVWNWRIWVKLCLSSKNSLCVKCVTQTVIVVDGYDYVNVKCKVLWLKLLDVVGECGVWVGVWWWTRRKRCVDKWWKVWSYRHTWWWWLRFCCWRGVGTMVVW